MQDQTANRFLTDAFRLPIEQRVSAHIGREWRVTAMEDKEEFASHPAAVLCGETFSIFVKLEEGEPGRERLEKEIGGLRLLAEASGVRTPVIIGDIQVHDATLLLMEAVELVERESVHWRQIGHALAQIHGVAGERFGLETHCYWGALRQDNSPLDDWPTFFWARRCLPRLRAALDSGNLPSDFVREIERLEPRLAELCGPATSPALVHGDAQQNNILSTAEGPVVIDPSVYYGHPEIDLAYVDFFAPVADELFEGYREVRPIDPGFAERRALWLIPFWLGMVEVEGPQHVSGLRAALGRYV